MSELTYVVAEDGTEVPDNVDDEEDCALLGTHGKVATLGVTLNRMCLGSGHERVVNLGRATKDTAGGIGSEGEDEYDDEEHDGVGVVGQEGSLDTTEHGVKDDTDGEKEASCRSGNASQTSDHSGPARKQHGSDQDVGHETEDNVNAVCGGAISCADSLEEGVRVGSPTLELDSKGCKKNDLDSGSACVPERTANAILVRHAGGLKDW